MGTIETKNGEPRAMRRYIWNDWLGWRHGIGRRLADLLRYTPMYYFLLRYGLLRGLELRIVWIHSLQ